jgi:hypothetical protein
MAAVIFKGKRAKALTQLGFELNSGAVIDNDGLLNYIDNGHGEINVLGWAQKKSTTPGSRPEASPGGSVDSDFTLTRNTSSPLRGEADLLITKTANNRQGNEWSYAFTIEEADKAKVMQITFDYQIGSGTYAGGTSSTDSDLICYIRRTTATARTIEPSVFKLDGAVVGQNYSFRGEFQTDSDATGYELVIYCATTSASAFTVKVDNVAVGPSKNVNGAITTDWNSYTPLFTGTTNGLAFTNSTNLGRWRRVGDSVELDIQTNFTGSPGTGTGSFQWSLPTGLVADTTKMTSGNNIKAVGVASYTDAGTNFNTSQATYMSTTTISALQNAAPNNFSATSPITWVGSDSIFLRALVPIVGWGATATLGQDADTRVVAARANLTTAQTGVASKVIPFNSVNINTSGSFNSTTGVFTAPVAGTYRVSAGVVFGSLDGVTNAQIQIRKNSAVYAEGYAGRLAAAAAANGAAYVSDVVSLVAGDTIDIFASGDASFDIDNNGSRTFVAIERMSGPSQIAASEVVSMRATSASTSLTSGAATTAINATIAHDTHNAYNTSTGIYTVPAAGFYQLSASAELSKTWQASTYLIVEIKVNGTTQFYGIQTAVALSGAGVTFAAQINGAIRLKAGDLVRLDVTQTATGTSSLDASATANFLCVSRIGI